MALLAILLIILALALLAEIFPEEEDKLCHAIYNFIMGGEDFE